MDNKQLAIRIVELVGGKENIIKAANCMTRLRITVKNPSLVNE
ncbi:PTS transporter subunit EIIB, partial [Vibrio parahaemolyticus]|nr:PTS transporter subunit EIIB [Vibrio parahaemolyticus]